MTKRPAQKSEGEETFALQLRAMKIAFEREVCLVSGRRWRWDFVIRAGELVLAIEIQGGIHTGGRHSRGAGYQNDIDKHNAVVRAGATPLIFSTKDAVSGRAITFIQELLLSRGISV